MNSAPLRLLPIEIQMNNNAAYDFVHSRHGAVTVLSHDTGACTQPLRTCGEWAQDEISSLLRKNQGWLAAQACGSCDSLYGRVVLTFEIVAI